MTVEPCTVWPNVCGRLYPDLLGRVMQEKGGLFQRGE